VEVERRIGQLWQLNGFAFQLLHGKEHYGFRWVARRNWKLGEGEGEGEKRHNLETNEIKALTGRKECWYSGRV